MTPNSTKVIMMCVEKGIQMGWARAYKHEDTPAPERIQDCVYEAVLYEIFEWFEFDREKNELS
jgi:hypothetical protein